MKTKLHLGHAYPSVTIIGSLFVVAAAVLAFGQDSRDGRRANGVTTPTGAGDELSASVRAPELIAVRFHHDLCPFCKVLGPKFAELVSEMAEEPVLFVTFDLSTEAGQNQAALLTAGLGLERLWPGDYSRLGTVTFVDGRTKQVLSTYRTADKQPLNEALRSARTLLEPRD